MTATGQVSEKYSPSIGQVSEYLADDDARDVTFTATRAEADRLIRLLNLGTLDGKHVDNRTGAVLSRIVRAIWDATGTPSTDPVVELALQPHAPPVAYWFACPLCHGDYTRDVFRGEYGRVVDHLTEHHRVTVVETKIVLDTTYRHHGSQEAAS